MPLQEEAVASQDSSSSATTVSGTVPLFYNDGGFPASRADLASQLERIDEQLLSMDWFPNSSTDGECFEDIHNEDFLASLAALADVYIDLPNFQAVY